MNALIDKTAVVALGGNALIKEGQRGTLPEQFQNARETCEHLFPLIAQGFRIAITHGNGPQVGFILMRSDLAAYVLHRLPLDVCVADSQGGIGYTIGSSLMNVLSERGIDRQVAVLLTHVVVDRDDPAFKCPTKPIGPPYPREEAMRHKELEGWDVAEEPGRGFRRVVPSPHPRVILEARAISALVEEGFIVIAAGGGGIPVVEESPGQYRGVEAVIDKDHASALLALSLKADLFLISTAEEGVAINYRTRSQRFLPVLTVEEARGYIAEGQFPPGSMGPKIEASIYYLTHGGKEVVITSPWKIEEALEERAGTRIVP